MTYKQVFTGLSLLTIGASRLLIGQEISITNANRLVEVCILNPEVIPEKHRALVGRDTVLQISLYHRSYEPRNDKEDWQPYGTASDIELVDQYPSPKRRLVPSKRVELDDHQFLAIFQKDRSFFTGSEEVILHLKGTYEFLFHYSLSDLFGEMPPPEACRRESNANNRIDVVLVNSATHTEKGLGESLDLERNVAFRIASYGRSYTPRNDKEGWKPAGDMSAQLVEQYPEPNFSQASVREVQVGEHELLLAFPRDLKADFRPRTEELILNVRAGFDVLRQYQYLLHYNLEDLGVIADVTEEEVVTKESLASERALVDVPASVEKKDDENSIDDIPVYELGEAMNVGYWGYKVYGYDWPPFLYAGRGPLPRAKYLRISIGSANFAKTPSVMPPFKLVDDEGAEYMRSHDAMGDDEYLGLLETLNPKVPWYGYLLFDVPQQDYWLELDGGYWSTEKARVRIERVDRQSEE